MHRCDRESKEKSERLQDVNEEDEVKDAGMLTPRRNERMLDKNINTLIREIGAKEYEEKVTKEVAKEK